MPDCNAPLKDGDWTCGACGAPVAGAGMAAAPGAGDYHAAYGGGASAPADAYGAPSAWHGAPGAAAAAAPASAGSSGLLRLVLIVAVIAVLAIVLVWFFVLRGPSDDG